MITITRLAIRNVRAISTLDLNLPPRGNFLIDAPAEGKTSVALAMRLALQGPTRGQELDDLIRHGSQSAEVELELRDGPKTLRIARQIGRGRHAAQARLTAGLTEGKADRPEAVNALASEFFAYPLEQVADFFVWSSVSASRSWPLAADRSYLMRAAGGNNDGTAAARALGHARSKVAQIHESKRHRELITKRLRLRRQLAGEELVELAPALARARTEFETAEAELKQLDCELAKKRQQAMLTGRAAETFKVTTEIIDQAEALDKLRAKLRMLNNLATNVDGGEAEFIRLRAKAGRVATAHAALVEAEQLNAQAADANIQRGRVGEVLSELVELRTGSLQEVSEERYRRWIDLTEQVSSAALAGVSARFDLGGPDAADPVRMKAQLRQLELEMTEGGLEIPVSIDQARQFLTENEPDQILRLESELESPAIPSDESFAREFRSRATTAHERAATMLFGLNLPPDRRLVESRLSQIDQEIEELERLAADPQLLVEQIRAHELEIVRRRKLLDQGREELAQREPDAGFEHFELDLDSVISLRDQSTADVSLHPAPADPALIRMMQRCQQRCKRAASTVDEHESRIKAAARQLDLDPVSALAKAAQQRARPDRRRQLQMELKRLETKIASLAASVAKPSGNGRHPVDEDDVELAERNLERLQRRVERRRQLDPSIRGLDKGLGLRAAERTIQNARNLLPRVSDGRYFDLQVEPNGTIRLWDEDAEDWIGAGQFGSSLRDLSELVIWLSRAVTHSGTSISGMPGFCLLDDPGALIAEPLQHVLADALDSDPMLNAIPQMLMLSGRRSFTAAGFEPLCVLGN